MTLDTFIPGEDYFESLFRSNGAAVERVEEPADEVPILIGTSDPSSFAARVEATRVDLVARIRDGIPPIDYLPASDGMLVRGKRHLIAAPKKEGKSISKLVHWVAMARAGARIVILDRENGANLYASRLESILAALDIDETEQAELAERLVYYEFPRLRPDDQENLVALCNGADVVVFDSQRMFLTDLGLDEDGSDDYAKFVGYTLDPLFRAQITTVVLDNTGHGDTKRSRGSSAKGDLNEILFTLEAVQPFDLETTGRVRLEITNSRFGNSGAWEMEIGGGVFGPWERVEATKPSSSTFRPTALMERASIYVEGCHDAVSRRTVQADVGGNAKALRTAIDVLVAEGYFHEKAGVRGARLVRSIKPYRQTTDPDCDQFDPTATNCDQDAVTTATSASTPLGVDAQTHSGRTDGDDDVPF